MADLTACPGQFSCSRFFANLQHFGYIRKRPILKEVQIGSSFELDFIRSKVNLVRNELCTHSPDDGDSTGSRFADDICYEFQLRSNITNWNNLNAGVLIRGQASDNLADSPFVAGNQLL